MTTATIIGIDVSQAFLDLWVLPQGKAGRVEYTDAGLTELVQELTDPLTSKTVAAADDSGQWVF